MEFAILGVCKAGMAASVVTTVATAGMIATTGNLPEGITLDNPRLKQFRVTQVKEQPADG